MKKVFITSLAAMAFSVATLNAHEQTAISEDGLAHETEHAHSKFYAAPKGVVILGNTIDEEHKELKGGMGAGIGADFGYNFHKYFAMEFTTTYAQSSVTESESEEGAESKGASAFFVTYGVDAVVNVEIIHNVIAVAKVGYGFEYEDLGDIDEKGTKHGITYALGGEYEITEHLEALVEYEGSTIESTRGHSIMFGAKFLF